MAFKRNCYQNIKRNHLKAVITPVGLRKFIIAIKKRLPSTRQWEIEVRTVNQKRGTKV